MNDFIFYNTSYKKFISMYSATGDRFIKIPEVNVGDFLITDKNVYTVLEVHDMSRMAPPTRKWITIVDTRDVISGKRIDITADNFMEFKDAVRVKGFGTVDLFRGGKNMKYDEIVKIIADVYKDKNTEDIKKMINDRYGIPHKIYVTSDSFYTDKNKEDIKKMLNNKTQGLGYEFTSVDEWSHRYNEDVTNKIYITSDGVKTVTARYGEIVATARCHDDDEFDIFKGARIALDRLEKAFEERKRIEMLDGWYNSLSSEKKQYLENRFKVKGDSHK